MASYGISDRQRAPSALAFDFSTKDFKRDPTTGKFLSQHWVDAAVFFYLRTAQGSIRSAPELGNQVQRIRYISKQTTQQTVQDLVLSALAPLLRRSLIRVVSIPVDLSKPGAIFYACNYVNLATGKSGSSPSLPLSQ